MSNHDDHWPVEGVSDVARQAALDAAARDGTPLGAWVEVAIREAAATDAGAAGATMADIAAAIDALAERIAAAEETTRRSVEPLRERLAELSRQLEEIERARQLFADDEDPGQSADDSVGDTAPER